MSASRLSLARQASRAQLKARVAIDGPTGAGKTWTALEWATSLAGDGGRIIVLDTEHGSAEWYSDSFTYEVVTWAPPYTPSELAATINEAQGPYDVIVVDSFSHFWEGEGGTRDIVDAAAERARGNSFAGWKVGTPALRHLIDSILAADAHVICTMRSKMEYVLEQDERGRQVPKKVGLAPVMRQGVEYEFTLIADMDLEHRMMVTKSRCPALSDQVFQPHRAVDGARLFLDWLDSGEKPIGQADADRLAAALNEAGQEARKAWLDRFNVRPTALPESRLDEANAFVATMGELSPTNDDPGPEPPPDDGGPGGNGQGSGGSADREAVDTNTPAPPGADGAGMDSPPEPAKSEPVPEAGAGAGEGPAVTGRTRPAVTPKQVGTKASLVWKAEYDAAPRGAKTRIVDRLRHALIYAQTGGEKASANACTPDELGQVYQRLEDIAAGRLTYEIQHGDDGGVTWISASGKRTTVMWAEAEMTDRDAGEAA